MIYESAIITKVITALVYIYRVPFVIFPHLFICFVSLYLLVFESLVNQKTITVRVLWDIESIKISVRFTPVKEDFRLIICLQTAE